MSNTELIDRLCAVTSRLADIVREQAIFIDSVLAVDDEARKRFEALREPVETELDLLEIALRPIHNTGAEGRSDTYE